MSVEYPVNVKTRQTAVNTSTTNSASASNKGAALTNTEMDMNLLNLKKAIDTVSAHFYVAHNTDGSLKPGQVNVDDLATQSIDYSKIKSLHYVEDSSTTANQITVTVNDLSALEEGMMFFVQVKTANTAATTLEVSNASGAISGGAKSLFKNKDVALTSGDLKADEIIGAIYDGAAFQLLGGGADSSIALSALANQSVGTMITFDTNGAPALVTAGTTNEVLTAETGKAPSFKALTAVANLPLFEYGETGTTAHTGNGSHFRIPSGITRIRVLMQGAGGGGHDGPNNHGGGGGGSGEYVEVEYNVTADDVYKIMVGHRTTGSGTATTIHKVTGYSTSQAGVLTETLYGQAAAGSAPAADYVGGVGGGITTSGNAAVPSSVTGDANLNYQVKKTVAGKNGGSYRTPYPGAAQQSDTDICGYGASSYKGFGAFGGVYEDDSSGKPGKGIGFGFGGHGASDDANNVDEEAGGGGWIAIYDVS